METEKKISILHFNLSYSEINCSTDQFRLIVCHKINHTVSLRVNLTDVKRYDLKFIETNPTPVQLNATDYPVKTCHDTSGVTRYYMSVNLVSRIGNHTDCDPITHSDGIPARTKGNRIPHCIPYRARVVSHKREQLLVKIE